MGRILREYSVIDIYMRYKYNTYIFKNCLENMNRKYLMCCNCVTDICYEKRLLFHKCADLD